MARRRLLAPELWTDTRVQHLTDFPRLVWIGMISQSDDEGIVEVDPPSLRAALALCASKAQVGKAVDQVIEVGLAVRYEVEGQSFAVLPGFYKHQTLERPTPTKHPRPPDDVLARFPAYVEGRRETFNRPASRHRGIFDSINPGSTASSDDLSANGGNAEKASPRHVHDMSTTCRSEEKRREENGSEVKGSVASAKPPPDPRVKVFLEWFGQEHMERRGLPYVATFGADGKALKGVFGALDGRVPDPVVALQEAAGRYFGDPWPCEHGGYTVRGFCSKINAYLGNGHDANNKESRTWPPQTAKQ